LDDILEELGPLIRPVRLDDTATIHVPRELSLNDRERQVLGIVGLDPQHLDELLRRSSLDPAATLATLTVLEMKRLVRRLPGSYVVRGS
ncbi:MAG: DNA-protecting protein DprA, partial [Planctomycetaceae bacterium]